MKIRNLLILLTALAMPLTAFGGAMTVASTFNYAAQDAELAEQLMLLLSERNTKGDYCDVKYFRDRRSEVLCNADDNSVIAFIDLFSGGTPHLEHRLDQQIDPGINPIDE